MSFAWLNDAGGLRYHLRGWRYATSLWQPFRLALAEWLYGWQPPERRLVLVGPSGGWCLQPFLFERFDEVICLEPDPIAHAIFRRKLARAPLDARPKLRFVTDDHLLAEPSRLVELVEREGDVALLFSNVLGQLRPLIGAETSDDARLAAIRGAVARATAGRSWASFHDRVSGSIAPELDSVSHAPARLDDTAILRRFYPLLLDESATRSADFPELLDHLTRGFFPAERAHAYFCWPLMPGVFHLIVGTHGVRSTADSRREPSSR